METRECIDTISPPPWSRRSGVFARPHRPETVALRAVIAFFERLAEWQQRAAGRRALLALGDRALKDIGLSRADVHREVAKPFWRA